MAIAFGALRLAALFGLAGFLLGYVGPILLTADANQGPLLGIFITGPLGFLVGLVVGAIRTMLMLRTEVSSLGAARPARSPVRAVSAGPAGSRKAGSGKSGSGKSGSGKSGSGKSVSRSGTVGFGQARGKR